MAIFVLAHGGWDGGWSWRAIAAALRTAGHDVYTPTLTGSGERAHLATPAVDLNTHIQDITNVMICEDLHEVMLVGSSYGGMVISGVAEQMPERISQMIYLDAFVPNDGESALDIAGPEIQGAFEHVAQVYGAGWRIMRNPPDTDRRTDLLLHAVQQVVTLKNPATALLQHTFVSFTDKADDDFLKLLMDHMAARAQARGWNYREMLLPHWPMLDKPHDVVQLLLELV